MTPKKPKKVFKAWAFRSKLSGRLLELTEMTGYGNLDYYALVKKPNEYRDENFEWVQVEIRVVDET